jgi:hypothetical protein
MMLEREDMSYRDKRRLNLSDRDVDFIISTASPDASDRFRLKEIIREDEDFRNKFIGDPKVLQRVMVDEEILLKISPRLFFEILLRNAVSTLEEMGYTLERTGNLKVPVFDSKEVVDLLGQEDLLIYLADMLSSFIKVESYSVSFRAKKGFWRTVRFSDLDLHSLMELCDVVEEEYRLGFYKRIADICLFIMGLFPDYVEREYRYPFSREVRPALRDKLRMPPEQYEEEGRKFYKLAAEHPSAADMDLSEVFWILHGHFQRARKPLNLIAEQYLHHKRETVFG